MIQGPPSSPEDQEAIEQLRLERMEMHQAYCMTFIDNPFGKKVLEHLKILHLQENDPIFTLHGRPEDTAFNLGRRFVIASLVEFIKSQPDEDTESIQAIEEIPNVDNGNSWGTTILS